MKLKLKYYTDLTHVTISRLRCFRECQRLYYWRYILRLEPKQVYIPFFVGSIYHIGQEHYWQGDSWKGISRAMKEGIKEYLEGMVVHPDKQADLEVQKHTSMVMMYAFLKKYPTLRQKWKVKATELEIEMDLNTVPFCLVGRVDLIFERKKFIWVGEHKTASQVDDSYISRIPLDWQVNGYSSMIGNTYKYPVRGVFYNIVQKPRIRLKQNQTLQDYLDEIKFLYTDTPDKYYYMKLVPLKSSRVTSVMHDVELCSQSVAEVYSKGDPSMCDNWERNPAACRGKYGNNLCVFYDMCKNGISRHKLLMFRQREIES